MKPLVFILFLWSTMGIAAVKLAGLDVRTEKTVSIAAGKKTVVVFLSAKCPCSQSHERVLALIAKENPDFAFFGVNANSDETASEAKAHFTTSALPFPVVRDDHAKLANHFGALRTPHVFVLNEAGDIVFRGGVDDSRDPVRAKKAFLSDALALLRAGRKLEVAETRPLGCAIER